MDAKNYYDPASNPIPPFKQNQFGFSVGGPVVIPKVYNGRNRTFFFLDYQGTRIRSGADFPGVGSTAGVAQRRLQRLSADFRSQDDGHECGRNAHAAAICQ